MDGNNIHSGHIKEALMHYFRLKRGWICADEVKSGGSFIGDIVVDTEKYTMEVEIKTSKNDLIRGEARKISNWGHGKKKHDEWSTGRANKFALCVPENLKEVAEEWINKTNKKYGLYIFSPNRRLAEDRISTYKRASFLHKNYDPKRFLYKIARRLSNCRAFELSSVINRNKK